MAVTKGQRPRASRRRTRGAVPVDFVAAVAFFLVISLFGGGLADWGGGTTVIALATVPAAVLFAWRGGLVTIGELPLAARLGLVGVAVLPLLQLVPLPPQLWQELPGGALRLGTLSLAGLGDSWQPLSLQPGSTALVAALAIAFVTLTGQLLRLDDPQFARMMAVAVGVVLAGIGIGLLQVVSDGWPELHAGGSGANMVGVFANKNHMALAIACAILLVGLTVARDLFGRQRERAVTAAFTILALVAIVTTNSRAGLILGGIATVIALARFGRALAPRWRWAGLALLVALVAAVITSDAFQTVSTRVGEVSDDVRWSILDWSRPLIERFWVWGSGLGSFGTVFATQQRLEWLGPNYINAVHNDYLQLVIEAGVPGVVVFTLLIVGVAARLPDWRGMADRDPRRAQVAAGMALVLLVVLHSAVDYPLRRPAAWVFLALALAAVFRRRSDGAGARPVHSA